MDYILNEQHNPLQITLLIPYRTIYSAQVIKQVVIKQSVTHSFLVDIILKCGSVRNWKTSQEIHEKFVDSSIFGKNKPKTRKKVHADI